MEQPFMGLMLVLYQNNDFANKYKLITFETLANILQKHNNMIV